jgi:hypothetical protein
MKLLRKYVNGDVCTNTGGMYFALLKRGVNGTFYYGSKEYLSRYCNEFSFKWNHRKLMMESEQQELSKIAKVKDLCIGAHQYK